MKINNPHQTASRLKLEKEIELYKSSVYKDPTLSARIKEHNSKYKEDLKLRLWGDWDLTNVTNMSRMFEGCITFNQPLTGWDVSNVLLPNDNK